MYLDGLALEMIDSVQSPGRLREVDAVQDELFLLVAAPVDRELVLRPRRRVEQPDRSGPRRRRAPGESCAQVTAAAEDAVAVPQSAEPFDGRGRREQREVPLLGTKEGELLVVVKAKVGSQHTRQLPIAPERHNNGDEREEQPLRREKRHHH